MEEYGGGICCQWYGSPTIVNCTIADNQAAAYGGGIFCHYRSNPTMTNCILWDNTAPNGHEAALMYCDDMPSTLTVQYSDVQGGAAEAYVDSGCIFDFDVTNLDDDPLFVKGSLHDYYLSQVASGQSVNSLCVNTGSDTAVNLGLDDLSTRTDGMSDEGIVDMGYHSQTNAKIYSIMRNGNDVTIEWKGRAAANYIVEWSYDMNTWYEVFVGNTNKWTDICAKLVSERYYRIKEE